MRRSLRVWAPAAVLLGALVVGGCSGGDTGSNDAGATTSTTVAPGVEPEPAAVQPPGSEQIGLRELETGQCFDTIPDQLVEELAVWALACAQLHSYEVYDLVTYEGPGTGGGMPYPGATTVQDWSEQACFERFEAFVGIRWTLSQLDIAVWWPSEESWGRGDRSVICTVVSDAGDQLTGSQRDTRA